MSIIDRGFLIGDIKIFEVDSDPRITPVDAPAETRIYWRSPVELIQFEKLDDGLTTNVHAIGFDNEWEEFYPLAPHDPIPEAANSDPDNPANDALWVPVLSFTTEFKKGGQNYQNFVQWNFNLTSTGRQAWFQGTIDGVKLPVWRKEPKDTDDNPTYPLTLPVHLYSDWVTPGTHTIEFKALIEPGGGATPTMTVTGQYSTIERKRL